MPRVKVSQRKDISGRGNLHFYKPKNKELVQKKHIQFYSVRI